MEKNHKSTYGAVTGEDKATHVKGREAENVTPEVPLTNGYVLGVAFYSFLGFTIVQTLFALRAGSAAMLADSEAMFVDAATYLCNMCAEHYKSRLLVDEDEDEHDKKEYKRIQRRRRLNHLYLELIPPLLSVTTLSCVTVMTLLDSWRRLSSAPSAHDKPDLQIMLLFSAVNLLLDAVNVTCFARVEQATILPPNFSPRIDDDTDGEKGDEGLLLLDHSSEIATRTTEVSSNLLEDNVDDDVDQDEEDDDHGINLNMCSAWTHVFADTLRSIAVLLAAGMAQVLGPSVISADQADAGAAIVVSIVILVSISPLLQGMNTTAREIIHLTSSSSARHCDGRDCDKVICNV